MTDKQFTSIFSRLPFEHSVIALLMRYERMKLTKCLTMSIRDGMASGVGIAHVHAMRRLSRSGVSDDKLLFVAKSGGIIKISTIQKSVEKAGKEAGYKRRVSVRALAQVAIPLD